MILPSPTFSKVTVQLSPEIAAVTPLASTTPAPIPEEGRASVTLPLTTTVVPLQYAPSGGEIMLTTGATVSTKTSTEVEEKLPASSQAVASRVFNP